MIKSKASLNFARKAGSIGLLGLGCMTALQLASWLVGPHSGSASADSAAAPRPDFTAAVSLPSTPEEKLHSTDDAAQAIGAEELIATIEDRWPDDHRRTFLSQIAPTALQSAVEHCVPPSVTLAQAIQESGWGRSGLAKNHGNLFGVKASSGGVVMPTTEVEHGKKQKVRARFASFEAWDESVAHHNALLAEDPRYASAREDWESWPQFLEALGPVYATDPRYVARVTRLVADYELDQWDALVRRAARKQSACAGSI